jgi:2-alkyl-3-oxoalkanoate reductase
LARRIGDGTTARAPPWGQGEGLPTCVRGLSQPAGWSVCLGMTRVFIAGATGVLGRYTLPLLLDGGYEVTGVARSAQKQAWLERLGARSVLLDVFDRDAVHRAVNGAEVIVNLTTAVPRSILAILMPGSWREMARVRRQVSANLADAALGGGTVRRMIQESFAPIYADGGDAWLDETSPAEPERYNRSTLDAEAQAQRLTRDGRIGVVLRFGLLYGPDDEGTIQMIDSVRRGMFPLPGRPEGYSSWVTHADAARAIVAALSVPAGVYNVVEDEPMRRSELAQGLARLLAVRRPRFAPAWATRFGGSVVRQLSRSERISNRKLRAASDWRPRWRTTLDGLRMVVEQGVAAPLAS